MAKMLKVILKNLFNKPATRLYPQTQRETFERSRGRIYFEEDNCIYCSICARKCPADAITVDRATSTWKLDAFRCIICGECVTACPKKTIAMNNQRRQSAPVKKVITVAKQTEPAASKEE